MAKHQRQWNEYEAAILLEGLLEIISDGADRKEIVRRVSSDLRKMAKNQGEEIDEIFRNENGISMQLSSIEYCYYHKPGGLTTSNLFHKTVELYETDRQQYNNLLREAHAMVEGSCEKEFRAWLSNDLPNQCDPESIINTLNLISDLYIGCGLIEKPILKTNSVDEINQIQDFIQNNTKKCIHSKKKHRKYTNAVNIYLEYLNANSKLNEKETEENSPKVETTEKEDEATTESAANKRLIEKYPTVYEKVLFALQELGSGQTPVSSVEIWKKIDHIEIISIIEEILNNATWSKKVVGGYYYKDHESPIEPQVRAPRPAPAVLKQVQQGEEYHNEKYENILLKSFSKGYRLNSAIDLSKFKALYKEAYGNEIPEDELNINNIIKMLCLVIDERAYLPKTVWDDGLKNKVFEYIDKMLATNKSCVYYKVLGEEFKEDFIKCPIPLSDSPKNLKTCLEYFSPMGYYFTANYVSKSASTVPDIKSEIRNYLIGLNSPATVSEIASALPHLPGDEIKGELNSSKEFIYNGHESYFHESILQISEGELEGIAGIIENAVKDGGVLSRDELYSYINSQFPSIIEYNPGVTDLGLYRWLARKYNGRFSFKGKIISSPNSKQSEAKIYANFARERESFTFNELKSFEKSLNVRIRFNSIYEYSVRVSKDQFISKSKVNFNITETDGALQSICTGNYYALPKFNSYHALPQMEYPWNSFLLESYLASYSTKFILVHESFNENFACGAMVKRSSGIKDFDGLLIQVLADSNIELNKDSALEFLKKEGYIVRKKQYNIEDLILRATAIRNGKGA